MDGEKTESEKRRCELCEKRIHPVRLRVLPNTNRCTKCSERYGSDYVSITPQEEVLEAVAFQ